MGLLLLILARILTAILAPIGITYSIIKLSIGMRFKDALKRIDDYFHTIAMSIDQTGNVFLQDILNDLMITKDGDKFGDEDQTISHVIGLNKIKGTLKRPGRILDNLLEFIDPGHSIKATKK